MSLKMVILSEYQNRKTFLLRDILKPGQKKFLLIVKFKIKLCGPMLLVI